MDAATLEALTWQGALTASSVAAFEDYLRQYPNGRFKVQAQQNIARLRAPSSTPAVAIPPPQVTRPATAAMSHGQTFRDCTDVCPEMVVIPSGSFVMGSPASEPNRRSDEGPMRTVRIAAFAAGKYEVTFAEWDACVSTGGCDNAGPLSAGGDNGWGRGRRPVIYVSWEDAQSYVRWLSRRTGRTYRLLTEAEWEYAARAGTTTPWHTGNSITTSQANHVNTKTELVRSYSGNAFDLYDVHGNVWEWVEDCYERNYSGLATDGSANVKASCSRVYRGGSWDDIPQDLRSAIRNRYAPSIREDNLGFRVARTL